MVNVLKFEIKINKKRIYKNLHLVENTASYNCAEDYFYELTQVIRNNMKITCLYNIIDNKLDFAFDDIECCLMWKKCVLCFISSHDCISDIVNDMISSGDYLKGYLLNEIATDVIFNCSNEMNKKIKEEVLKTGYKLTRRYAPGDGILGLNHQQTIFDALKKEVHIDAYLTESFMIVPEKSMMYLFGVEKDTIEGYDIEQNCSECSNINCQYRK